MEKVSLRMCVACREMKPKREFFRIVRSPEGAVHTVPVGTHAPGRSAYICRSLPCCEKAEKSRALERAFKLKVDPMLYTELKGACRNE